MINYEIDQGLESIMLPMTLTKFLASLCLLLASCGGHPYDPGSAPSSANLPSDADALGEYKAVNVFPNLSFNTPLFVTGVPNEERLLVVEQRGRIVVFENNSAASSTTTILDLESRLLFSGEQGLLGIVLDPQFAQNRLVYLHYSMGEPRRSVISRMIWNKQTDQIDVASEKLILEIPQPYSNHNGGMLAFGPDGYLFIGVGDGGSGGDPKNHGQNKQTLLGALLRLDVHPADATTPYVIPPDNPFVDDAGARPEIYAFGLRNPFRFSFDRQSGDLWLGDVGQNKVEEIDIIESGGNYGWRVYEASQPFDSSLNSLSQSEHKPPVFEYDHSQGYSVTGGYVYRGNALPALVGRYLFADYGSGKIWALTLQNDKAVANTLLDTVPQITSFGETNSGEVLIVSRSKGIFKLAPQ